MGVLVLKRVCVDEMHVNARSYMYLSHCLCPCDWSYVILCSLPLSMFLASS